MCRANGHVFSLVAGTPARRVESPIVDGSSDLAREQARLRHVRDDLAVVTGHDVLDGVCPVRSEASREEGSQSLTREIFIVHQEHADCPHHVRAAHDTASSS